MKKHINRFSIYAGIVLLLLAMQGCDSPVETSSSFDRSVMLQNFADNLILPAYTELKSEMDALSSAAEELTNNPSAATLTATQVAWEKAYLAWQYANAYNIGLAAEQGLRKGLIEEIGTFPISENKIQEALTTGNYNLNDFNRDARGFLAIEYLLFSLTDNNSAIVNAFASANRKKLLNDLVADTRTRITEVLNAWNGTYKAAFIANNGTDVGSSTSQFYNEFVRSFETIKNFKVRLPLGLAPGQTQAEPTKVEAYYSGTSVKMFKAHMTAIENIWYGRKKDGIDGVGFKEYLENVAGGEALIKATVEQLEKINSTRNAVPETPRLSAQVVNSPAAASAFHTELQKHTRLFKSDMSSLLGLAITFSSGDGD